MLNQEKVRFIEDSVNQVLDEIPDNVTLVAAVKTRSPEEALAAIEASIEVLGHNYVQEAEQMMAVVGDRARWHMIGHLQKNKVNKAAPLFNMVETVDSLKLAQKLNRSCERLDKVMSVLIEVNSGREEAKDGVFPEDVEALAKKIAPLQNLSIKGLMTMGPYTGDPENARPYFRETKRIFDHLSEIDYPRVNMEILSMGMSNSYRVAIEEGATMIRLGTRLFGPR